MSFLLFLQHGWADTHRKMQRLAQLLGQEAAVIPDLGFWRTWGPMAPLVDTVEAIAQTHLVAQPELPVRVVGHSMGGLIWLELLQRRPEWRSRLHSLVLLGSPVGGADLARLLQPLSLWPTVAPDLARSRRDLATAIAREVPVLSLASDWDGGSDGTVLVQSTWVAGAYLQTLPGIRHPVLHCHPATAAAIQKFWSTLPAPTVHPFTEPLVQKLAAIPGMTDAHPRDRHRAQPWFTTATGWEMRRWVSPLGLPHVFVWNPAKAYAYGGWSGDRWGFWQRVQQAVATIPQSHSPSPVLGEGPGVRESP
ncbi:MAG TPA: lysophospholipase [Cyanobacteria bacterium UBA8156]|jgi:pimeloyl-ACP methyl ester carboxylesterase|nr:lysophospholipase [Cyanobacteria bacterium UBA8156]